MLQRREDDYEDLPEEVRRDAEAMGRSTLERYTGSAVADFQPHVLLVNFDRYLDMFSKRCDHCIQEGSAFSVVHWPEEKTSMVNYGVGSPTAALITELLSFISTRAVIMLGLCGGLRAYQSVGDFFSPVAAIRDEGTSHHFLPPQVPALASFTLQRFIARALENRKLNYHTGVIHTTNYRFWEFNAAFKDKLHDERAQAIDMECATLFCVGYARSVPIGALMLISDKPLERGGVKTKESARKVFDACAGLHLDLGLEAMRRLSATDDELLKRLT